MGRTEIWHTGFHTNKQGSEAPEIKGRWLHPWSLKGRLMLSYRLVLLFCLTMFLAASARKF